MIEYIFYHSRLADEPTGTIDYWISVVFVIPKLSNIANGVEMKACTEGKLHL